MTIARIILWLLIGISYGATIASCALCFLSIMYDDNIVTGYSFLGITASILLYIFCRILEVETCKISHSSYLDTLFAVFKLECANPEKADDVWEFYNKFKENYSHDDQIQVFRQLDAILKQYSSKELKKKWSGDEDF